MNARRLAVSEAKDRPRLSRDVAARMVRSLGVGAATTILTNAVLVTLTIGFGVRAGLANVVGTLCGIGPSYAWNRRYAWQLRGPSDVKRQVVPFWVLSIVGLVVSTVAVDAVGTVGASWTSGLRAVALPAANLTVFATLWLVQFVVLDRLIFRRRRTSTIAPAPPLENQRSTAPTSRRPRRATPESARSGVARQSRHHRPNTTEVVA